MADFSLLSLFNNLDKICRVCLKQSEEEMYNLFDQFQNVDKTQEISTHKFLMNISNMKIRSDDGLPDKICNSCMELAQLSFKFQLCCNTSEKILHNCLLEMEKQQEIRSDLIKTSNELNNVPSFQKCETNELVQDKQLSVCLIKKKNQFTCKMCGKKFKNSVKLKNHLSNHCKKKPYNICQIRGENYDETHIKLHKSKHSYDCKTCGKKYKQAGSLKAHMRIHTGQKPFLCSACGKAFRQSSDLSYHMRTHTNEKPYMCNICGKTMRMQSHLVQHMRIHTGERPYKCKDCEKAFYSSTMLKRHSIIHTSLKPYKCEVCEKSFNRSSTLNVHSKTHRGERPHVCSVCGKRFIQAHVLRVHLLTHNITEKYQVPNSVSPLIFVVKGELNNCTISK